MKTLLRCGLAAALIFAVTAPALAQVSDEDRERGQRRIGNSLQDAIDGAYKKAPKELGRELKDIAQGQTLTVKFEASAATTLLGVCDEMCSKIDMTVKDASGAIVGTGSGANDAKVALKPAAPGSFTLEVKLGECDGSKCWVAAGAYAPN